jgi:hypothetical protein
VTGFRALALLLWLWLASAPARAGVILNEIYYHPPVAEGELVEFVEIENATAAPADLSGWRLRGGIKFTFPQGTVLGPGSYLVVCRDRQRALARFGGPASAYLGDYQGALDNNGDSVELQDSFHAVIDAVVYDDKLPWPEAADGKGSALRRVCADSSGEDPLNWTAGLPTPAAANPGAGCPAPAYRTPLLVFSEIHYHPRSSDADHPALEDGEDEEFLEIHNPGAAPVDLEGFKIEDDVRFTFPAGVSIQPGGFLAVCRKQEVVKARYGAGGVIGDYSGRLSDSGGRVALVDPAGRWIDSVKYADSGDWPYGADGRGRSLQKVVLAASGNDPRNWQDSLPDSSSFRRLTGEGKLAQGLTQTFLLWLDGPGEALVDNVVLSDLSTPGQNLLVNGSFDAGIDGWTAAGITSGSLWAPGEGVGGTGALRLVSSGRCPGGECSTASSVSAPLPAGLDRSATYRVSVDLRYRKGSPLFRAGLFLGAGAEVRQVASPGSAGGGQAAGLPLSISHVHRFPEEPRSGDTTWITALVRPPSGAEVTLAYRLGGVETTLPMFDDGTHRDGGPGDGVYGAALPAFPHNTQVLFLIRAVLGTQMAEYPRLLYSGSPVTEELAGYYVNDLQPATDLPVYQVLLPGMPGADIDDLNRYLSCETVESGSFAFKGELYPEVAVRFRGNTACFVHKRALKVVFNQPRLFHGLKQVDLNGMESDKALVRERLAWDLLRDMGAPALRTEYVRVHLNGEYHGLFLDVEHPDQRFLARIGLPDGNLYKSLEPALIAPNPLGVERQGSVAGYRLVWNAETNGGGDYTDLAAFIDAMFADGRKAGGPTAAFWQNGTLEEMIITYQAGMVLLNDVDSYAKNHLLYHDLQSGRWGITAWDLDLTFGKFFDPGAVGPGRPVGTLNDAMLSDPSISGDLNPWFGAQVLRNPLLNHFVDFFLRAGNGVYQRAYLIQLWDLLEEKYRNESFDPKLDALLARLEAEEAEDHARWGRYPSNLPGFPQDMRSNVEIVKQQIRRHRDFLRSYIQTFHRTIPGHPRAKITEVMYWPEAGQDDLEFIEFWNPGTAALDVSGWTVPAVDFTFPASSTIPPGGIFVLARNLKAFSGRYGDLPLVFGPYTGKLANEGEELSLLDAGPGHPAVIDRVPYENLEPWPLLDPGQSLELTAAGLDGDGSDPASWAGSARKGGSPGTIGSLFVRGDVDGNQDLDLSDPILVLGYLFLGAGAPACLEAADADDNGAVDVSDAIQLLDHLFNGGPQPPAPYPVLGKDPTPDGLGCSR